MFTIKGDLTIASQVGVPLSAYTPGNDQLQGFFSADGNVLIQGGGGTCATPDTNMLNVGGSIVANAARSGGTFQNLRCGDANPSFTIEQRADMILNAPSFLKEQHNVSQEVAP